MSHTRLRCILSTSYSTFAFAIVISSFTLVYNYNICVVYNQWGYMVHANTRLQRVWSPQQDKENVTKSLQRVHLYRWNPEQVHQKFRITAHPQGQRGSSITTHQVRYLYIHKYMYTIIFLSLSILYNLLTAQQAMMNRLCPREQMRTVYFRAYMCMCVVCIVHINHLAKCPQEKRSLGTIPNVFYALLLTCLFI